MSRWIDAYAVCRRNGAKIYYGSNSASRARIPLMQAGAHGVVRDVALLSTDTPEPASPDRP